MQQQILFQNIFNKIETAKDTPSFLLHITNEYPYFGLANYYCLKNTTISYYNYENIAAFTSMFFNNKFLLNANLQIGINEKSVYTKEFENQSSNATQAIEDAEALMSHHPLVAKEEINNAGFKEIPKLNFTYKKPAPINTTPLVFEPLFASDYFASQGIKLSEAILGDDKLGKQLKSFTSWLKTMKKVHPDKLEPVTATVETAVQHLAEKSNVDESIITEAMAEAYTLQHKYKKAIEIYQKLSLINPAKIAYFAAKIEHLNK